MVSGGDAECSVMDEEVAVVRESSASEVEPEDGESVGFGVGVERYRERMVCAMWDSEKGR